MEQHIDGDIEIFESLLSIAERHNISQTAWAKAAWPKYRGNAQTRISELRRISDTMKSRGVSQAEACKMVKRKCTYAKLLALHKGLVKMIGKDISHKEFAKLMKSTKKLDTKLFFALNHADDETKQQILSILVPLIEAKATKKE